ncbi:unnamed protein product, partial [Amoebophrya sp. A25]
SVVDPRCNKEWNSRSTVAARTWKAPGFYLDIVSFVAGGLLPYFLIPVFYTTSLLGIRCQDPNADAYSCVLDHWLWKLILSLRFLRCYRLFTYDSSTLASNVQLLLNEATTSLSSTSIAPSSSFVHQFQYPHSAQSSQKLHEQHDAARRNLLQRSIFSGSKCGHEKGVAAGSTTAQHDHDRATNDNLQRHHLNVGTANATSSGGHPAVASRGGAVSPGSSGTFSVSIPTQPQHCGAEHLSPHRGDDDHGVAEDDSSTTLSPRTIKIKDEKQNADDERPLLQVSKLAILSPPRTGTPLSGSRSPSGIDPGGGPVARTASTGSTSGRAVAMLVASDGKSATAGAGTTRVVGSSKNTSGVLSISNNRGGTAQNGADSFRNSPRSRSGGGRDDNFYRPVGGRRSSRTEEKLHPQAGGRTPDAPVEEEEEGATGRSEIRRSASPAVVTKVSSVASNLDTLLGSPAKTLQSIASKMVELGSGGLKERLDDPFEQDLHQKGVQQHTRGLATKKQDRAAKQDRFDSIQEQQMNDSQQTSTNRRDLHSWPMARFSFLNTAASQNAQESAWCRTSTIGSSISRGASIFDRQIFSPWLRVGIVARDSLRILFLRTVGALAENTIGAFGTLILWFFLIAHIMGCVWYIVLENSLPGYLSGVPQAYQYRQSLLLTRAFSHFSSYRFVVENGDESSMLEETDAGTLMPLSEDGRDLYVNALGTQCEDVGGALSYVYLWALNRAIIILT